MPYLGNGPSKGIFQIIDDISSQFNGVQTIFELTVSGQPLQIGSLQNLQIHLNKLYQEPFEDILPSGTTSTSIRFAVAPTSGMNFGGMKLGDVLSVNNVSNNTIGNEKIVDGAITATKLATDAVTNTKVSNGAITSTKLATDSVTNLKILNGVVTQDKVADGSINANKLADNAVTANKILDNIIAYSKINSTSIATITDVDNSVASKLVDAVVLKTALNNHTEEFPVKTRAIINQATNTLINGTNIASITSMGTGITRITFTAPYADTNYNVQASALQSLGLYYLHAGVYHDGTTLRKTTTYVDIMSFYGTSSSYDSTYLDVVIFGKLAP